MVACQHWLYEERAPISPAIRALLEALEDSAPDAVVDQGGSGGEARSDVDEDPAHGAAVDAARGAEGTEADSAEGTGRTEADGQRARQRRRLAREE